MQLLGVPLPNVLAAISPEVGGSSGDLSLVPIAFKFVSFGLLFKDSPPMFLAVFHIAFIVSFI